MFKPMPSPRGTNREGLYVPAHFVASPVVAAYDAVGGLTSRRPAAPASGPARKPATSTAPSVSPTGAPKKPGLDGPSKEAAVQTILDFLVGHLEDETFLAVEQQLKRSFLGSGAGSESGAGTAYGPAADRRPRVAADSGSERSFFARFPSAKKIGAA
jgi:hypothetical protein